MDYGDASLTVAIVDIVLFRMAGLSSGIKSKTLEIMNYMYELFLFLSRFMLRSGEEILYEVIFPHPAPAG